MQRVWHKDPPPPEDDGIPSKTQRKQEMHALQDLGERLAELTADRLARLELPERLAIAINEYRRFNKWEAKRRQMQYIGKLMRDVDAAPILAQLDIWAGTSRAAVAGFHAVEEWRERLLAEPGSAGAKGATAPVAKGAAAPVAKGAAASIAKGAAAPGAGEVPRPGASALDALVTAYPETDRARIALLVDRARAERASGRPPASFRLLFRELARLVNKVPSDGAQDET